MADFDEEREATIARNRALLAQLDVTLDIPKPSPKTQSVPKARVKPVKPAKKREKRSQSPAPAPLRQSKRLRRTMPALDETPEQRRIREQEEEALRKKAEDERLAEEERAREASKPRHADLEMYTLLEDTTASEVLGLTSLLEHTLKSSHTRPVGRQEDGFDEDPREKRALAELRAKFHSEGLASRAKVTRERIYSAAYHPEVRKDLIFFGDKHGALGIWDPGAEPEVADDDDNSAPTGNEEGGKYWRMQLHWPATSSSSISAIKFDPVDSHSVYTSSYDCTIRSTSFVSGISREVFDNDGIAIQSFDLTPSGHELWFSDKSGGVTHLDLREDKSKARWYQLSADKIGCVSINPVDPMFLLTASNSRALRVWDARKLDALSKDRSSPVEIHFDEIEESMKAKSNAGLMRAEWRHGQSASSAYWDSHGRRIVSTSYDNTIRLWDVKPEFMQRSGPFPTFRPTSTFSHNCQTGKWVTILRAQWSPSPDAYPHITIGNMDHTIDIRTYKGELVAKLQDKKKISAVQAVTCSHPTLVNRIASGNASGRCVLFSPTE
ncbi:WD40 repeat-like protein [Trametopsis cervina]|nr:WD40 repeat-like protein [Trametopsis cervina]